MIKNFKSYKTINSHNTQGKPLLGFGLNGCVCLSLSYSNMMSFSNTLYPALFKHLQT